MAISVQGFFKNPYSKFITENPILELEPHLILLLLSKMWVPILLSKMWIPNCKLFECRFKYFNIFRWYSNFFLL